MPNYPIPPQVYLDTHYIAPTGASIVCPDAASFSNALISAQLGDEIVLTSGVIYTGNFTMPVKSTGTGYVTIRSSDPRSL
ncbi:MAG TPA: hypothetical protein DEQ40_19165, partial [Oxalobacteraceae bacterium]|nr:hypothetical protein [Oxalobacteraceae bacterium]